MVDFNGNLVREQRRRLSPGKIQLLITYKSLALKGNKHLFGVGTEEEGSLWRKWSTASATGLAMTSGHENQILVIQIHLNLVISCYWGRKGHLRMQTNHLGWSWMCKKELSPKTTTLCSQKENKEDPLSTQTSVISSRYSGWSPPGDHVLLYQSHI